MAHHFPSPLPSPVEERELVRQLQLARQLFAELGGSLPRTQIDPAQVQTALDVGCGAGGWVLDVAHTYPHMQVTGIDLGGPCLAYARRLAEEGDLSNARFVVHDMRSFEQDDFSPDAFDLIHLAFLASTLLTTDYPALLRALFRLCRPGGMVCWTEMEFPITTSPAFEHLTALTCRALQTAGQSFVSPSLQELAALFACWRRETERIIQPDERRHLGITPMMGSWLRASGYHQVRHLPTAIEVSTGTGAHPCFVRQVEVFGQQIRAFLLEQQVISKNAWERLLSQVLDEVQQESFCGLCFVLTTCAHKPLEDKHDAGLRALKSEESSAYMTGLPLERM
jgi:ubiquinone/menaquinone biosynthesis C-methylase UbiE